MGLLLRLILRKILSSQCSWFKEEVLLSCNFACQSVFAVA